VKYSSFLYDRVFPILGTSTTELSALPLCFAQKDQLRLCETKASKTNVLRAIILGISLPPR